MYKSETNVFILATGRGLNTLLDMRAVQARLA